MTVCRLDHLPPGSILVVADNDAIARGAPTWATVLAHAGRQHRVRLAGPSSHAAVAAEAQSLKAVAILWAGSHDVHDCAATAAAHLGIPLLNEEILHRVQTP